MPFPIVPVVMPADLAGKANGQLPGSLLTVVHGGGKLHHLAARAWTALVAAAWSEVGLPLTFTFGGTYRSYASQETLFRSRYDPSGTGGGCKTWNGVRWCKKSSNLATAAVPGTSNHGWGLAIDCAWDRDLSDGIGPDDATGITSHPGWHWLLANADRFGFSWELQSEPWHLRYVTGDQIPGDVLAFENPNPPPPPPPPIVGVPDVFTAIAPVRNSDTRAYPGKPVGPGELTFGLNAAIPDDAVAVAVNVVAISTSGAGFVTVWPGGPRPDTSVVNFLGDGHAHNGAMIVGVSNRSVQVYTSQPAHLIVDITGYWTTV